MSMSRLICILILMFGCSLAEFPCRGEEISSEKLMLHYDFSRFSNGLIDDLSGSGHHGKMFGTFKKVKCQGHRGVLFNQKDTAVVPAMASNLRLDGPFSIALRMRITPGHAEAMKNGSPLLFGAPDTRSILRNYTIFFDYGKRLELDVGDGLSGYNAFTSVDLADGKLHDVVYIVAPPMAWIYIDGKCVKEASCSVVPSKSAGQADPILGCWGLGRDHFLGELYELRLYNRALSYREVASFSGLEGSVAPKGQFECTYSPWRKALDWDVSVENLPEKDGIITVEIDGIDKGKHPYAKNELIGERLSLNGETTAEKIAAGVHRVDFIFRDLSGKLLYRHQIPVEFEELKEPGRFDNQIGITDEVLPPWTPMKCEKRDDRILVSIWNRTYCFGKAPLSMNFISGEEALLADDSSLLLRKAAPQAGSKLVSSLPRILLQTPHRVILQQDAENEDVALKITHTIEYDGFDHIQMEVAALKEVKLQQLHLRIPLDKKHASYSVPGLNGLARADHDIQYEFTPALYLGDHEKGLYWLADSDQFWMPYDHKKAISVEPKADAVLMTARFIDAPAAMAPGQKRMYEFALEATPVRPFLGSAWERRVVVMAPYCCELELLSSQRNGVSALEDYARLGARAFAVMRVERPFAYPMIPGSDYARAMAPILEKAHDLGIRMYPYAVSFVFSKLIPEWNERELIQLYPRHSYTDCGDTLERETGVRQEAFHVCNNRYYQNLMLYRLQKAMENDGVDGVYLDGTTSTRRCTNYRHGCGYRREDGTYVGTYGGFATRQMMKRLYALVWKLRGEKGGVDLHMSDVYNIPASAWATTRFMGEGLPKNKLITESLSPEHFRLLYTGKNIGTPVDFLAYTTGQPFHTDLALSMIHDMPTRPHGGMKDIDELSCIWKTRDSFGCDQAKFIGYWEESCPLGAREKDVFVSVYRRDDNHLMAVISNLSGENKTVHLFSKHGKWMLPENLLVDSQNFKMLEVSPACEQSPE